MLRVAIVGTGNISAAHIEGYLTLKDKCEIVALVDIIPEKAQARKERFGLSAKVYDSHKTLLNEGLKIDLVSICTPPFTHASIAIDFLNAGVNTLVEKPMAASLEESDAMLEAEKSSGKLLSIVAQNRFRTSIMAMKQILDSGYLGDIRVCHIDSLWWRGHSYYDLWWRGCWDKEGGGCTLNHAVHHIDMLCWMMPKANKVTSVLANVAHDNAEVEDISIAVVQHETGALSRVTSSVVHHGQEQQIVFQGIKGSIKAPWKSQAEISLDNGFPIANQEWVDAVDRLYNQFIPLKYEGHTGQIDNVITAIVSHQKPLITGEDGRKTIEIITVIYKSGFEEKSVILPIDKNDLYYTTQGILSSVKHFHEKQNNVTNLDGDNITLGSNY